MRIVNKTGLLGEEAACEYLLKKGYRIIERNFRIKYEELDIIAVDRNALVFIEVKTRTNDSFGSPFESISGFKLKHLVNLAHFYKSTHKNLPEDMRIDAIAVTVKDERVQDLEHLINVTL